MWVTFKKILVIFISYPLKRNISNIFRTCLMMIPRTWRNDRLEICGSISTFLLWICITNFRIFGSFSDFIFLFFVGGVLEVVSPVLVKESPVTKIQLKSSREVQPKERELKAQKERDRDQEKASEFPESTPVFGLCL